MQHEVASLRQAIAAREQEIAATLREAKGEEAAATFEAKAAAAACTILKALKTRTGAL